ncbi:MAG: hypothetical protein Q8P50_10060 [Bacillota bacterium]|nr:hypothetical protein [Bacillota bacterium]
MATRFTHTPYEPVDRHEVTQAVRLVLAVLEETTPGAIKTMLDV